MTRDPKKATADDIASVLGTSRSAVSRAFKPDAPISDALRADILATATRLGYRPPDQRNRDQRGVRSFCVVVSDIHNTFYSEALARLARLSASADWEMTVFIVPDGGSVDSLAGQVLAARSDAVLFMTVDLRSRLASECTRRRLPAILFNRVQVDSAMLAITSDNYGGGRLAAARLLEQSWQRIAFLGGKAGTSTHLERRRGFVDGLAAQGADLAYDLICDFSYDAAFEVAGNLLRDKGRPTGIFCANDTMAFAAIDAARDIGLLSGQDLGVIGYDDVPMAGWSSYNLTTISQQVDLMIDRALVMMDEATGNAPQTSRIDIVPASLILRSSDQRR